MVRDGQDRRRGFTLLELMFAVAVLGILGMAVAHLIQKVAESWLRGKATLELHAAARRTGETLVNDLRSASISNIILTQADGNQPPMSKICYVDSFGNSRMIYQVSKVIYRAAWSGNTATAIAPSAFMQNYVENFSVYYPNIKEPNKLGYSLLLEAKPQGDAAPDISVQTAGVIELKTP